MKMYVYVLQKIEKGEKSLKNFQGGGIMTFKEELIEFYKDIVKDEIDKYLIEEDKINIKQLIKEQVKKHVETYGKMPETIFLKVHTILRDKPLEEQEQIFSAMGNYINTILGLKVSSTHYHGSLIIVVLE